MIRTFFRYAAAIIILLIAIILLFSKKEHKDIYIPREYDEIKASGVLRAITDYNSISLHLTGDTINGFDYELLNTFAKDKGLRLEITPETSFEKRFEGIIQGKYDVLATPTEVTSQLKDSLFFTRTILLSKQVLVQRKKEKGKDSLYIKRQLDLANKHIHLIKNSPALLRMENLMNEIADTIYIHEVARYTSEQLLAMVSAGEIDYAVCDEKIAQSAVKDYPNLDIQTDLSFTQFYSWGVNKRSLALRDTLDQWLDKYMESKAYKTLYHKYFH